MLLLERNGGHGVIVGALGETGLHTHQRVYVLDDGVALLRSVHQSFKHQLRLGVVRKRHHLIPIGRRAPVALNQILVLVVRMGVDFYGLHVAPVGIGSELAHHPQREVDVRTRYDAARHAQLQSVLEHRTNHEQRRDVLRTDVAGNLQIASFERTSLDAERRIALVGNVFDVGTEIAQRVNEYAYGAVLHAFGSGDDVLAGRYGQIGCHEAHGCACRLDVDDVGIAHQGIHYNLRVVAHRKVLRQHIAVGQSVYNERAVADAL